MTSFTGGFLRRRLSELVGTVFRCSLVVAFWRKNKPMTIRSIPAKNLGDELVQKWKHLQQGNHHLDNPFFCPEYTMAIANAR